MPKLSKKKVSIGQLRDLTPEEQKNIIEPIIKANQAQFAKLADIAKDALRFKDLAQSISQPFYDIANSIKLPEPAKDTYLIGKYTPPQQKTKSELELEAKQSYLADLHIQLLEAQLAVAKGAQTPQYDTNTGIITFMGKAIEIPLNTNVEMVARVVLKNVENMRRKWSWDEIVEKNHESTDNFTQGKIYTAARAINEKVAKETTIKDFLVTKPIQTVRLNPDFLPK